MKSKWKSEPLPDRIGAIICIVVSLLGVTMLCQAYLQWETNRKIAFLNIGVAVFVFICSGVVFFIN